MADADAPILLLVTAGGRDDAERLGEALVVDHLAASCSVVPTMRSFFFVDGLLQREHEALLMVRTLASKRAPVMKFLDEHHSHTRPEIIELDVSGGSLPYLDWVAGQVTKSDSNR